MAENTPAYLDTSLSFSERADDLVGLMTLQEKVSQMVHGAAGIERLGIPDYNWWNECIHGVARAGVATVFPQSIGLAATWNTELMSRVATVISDEARAKYHDKLRKGEEGERYYGLTFWSPNINIVRDPRWGRSQETYGEDPYLTARMGVVFTKGIQGDDPKYLKTAACGKHYAVHSGPEPLRHEFDAVVDERDLRETYLPAFEALVREAKVEAIMSAYSGVNGTPCTANSRLLQEILRDEWGFDGHVVSDCGAVCDLWRKHKYVETPIEASVEAVRAGCDLNCGQSYPHICRAVRLGTLDEKIVDRAVRRLMITRLRLGMFDPPEMVPFTDLPIEINNCAEHRELAREAALQSMVLLRNENNALPLDKNIKRLAVIGPLADDPVAPMGNYEGSASDVVTPLEGIRRAVGPDTEVRYEKGCELVRGRWISSDAIIAANKADVIVMVLGLSPALEGEAGDSALATLAAGGDRTDLILPGPQERLLETICAIGKPVVLVLMGGSSLAIPWAGENVPAIVMSWYGGEEAGAAVAEVLFGDCNPAGRLPLTFYRSVDQLPEFTDYRMAGRTYRYFDGEVVYPFGHGLSYTTFGYDELSISPASAKADEEITISARVTNTGELAGDEVVQLYVRDVEASVPVAIRSLAGFRRIHLAPGESQQVSFTLEPKQLSVIDDNGQRIIEPGEFEISVGGGQPLEITGQGSYITAMLKIG